MSTSICQSNLTSGFIDLATYDELEKYMYGGSDAIAYFVRETRKATWFTQVPVQLANCEGIADFGQDWSVSISRSGDYLLGTWLHVQLPAVSVAGWNARSVCVAWTPNLMHALVKNCCITFNDLVAARFDGTHLDFWAAFTTPASKAEGYRAMIGSQIPTCGGFIPSQTCDLPLPFFYTRDSGVALPTAALPYNEMRISFTFRPWNELLVGFAPKVDCFNYAVGKQGQTITGASATSNQKATYIVPSYNSSASGIQPCWNSDIWPTCTTTGGIAGVEYKVDILAAGSAGSVDEQQKNQLHNQYQKSDEMSFIILPKLEGVPTSYLEQSGINQVTQSKSKSNFNMKGDIPYYVGEPVNKRDDGVFCDLRELSLKCQVWANYAIVSNEERKKMACAPRDILIEQVQQTPPCDFNIRNQPDSRWWPNNISKLAKADAAPNEKAPTVPQAPIGSGGSGVFVPAAFDASGNAVVPDNEIPCGEQNWPTVLDNFLPQQPSQQGQCLSALGFPATDSAAIGDGVDQWRIGGVDNDRHVACETSSSATVHLNLRYAYSVKALFFAVKNITATNIHSNYTIGFPVLQASATDQVTLDGPVFSKGLWDDTIDYGWDAATAASQLVGDPSTYYRPCQSGGISKFIGKIQNVTQSVITCKNGFDPIERASLLYETTPRLGLLDASYYSLTQPYYHAPSLPSSAGAPVFCPTGYHMYSYSLEFESLDPLGSTNYGKLTNVSLDAEPIRLNSSNLCPELAYAVPMVNDSSNPTTHANPKYVYGPINGPGLVGNDAKSLANQSVLEVLINMAYQNIFSEQGLETISPMIASGTSIRSSQCTFLGKYSFVSTAINNNILRISGGSVGLPVL